MGKDAQPLANPRLQPRWTHPRYYGLVGLRNAMRRAIADHVAPLKIDPKQHLTAVDLGCGTLPYRPLFEAVVANYLGADLPANSLAAISLDAQSGRVDLPAASADLVISTQVLEHVESPEKYLDEAYRLCKPGGLLLLSTHGFWKYHPDPTDYWRWTASGLCKLLKDQGWDVVDRQGILGFAAAAASLMQDAIVVKLPRVCRQWASVVLQQFVGLLDLTYSPQSRRENAALYLIVARRPAEALL